MEFPRFQWWGLPLWVGKEKKGEKISNGVSPNNSYDHGFDYGSGIRETDSVKFPLKGARTASSSPRKIKKKWHSREERKIDREHDVVLVPSDGVCLSGSESDDSDWSIGWLEPHGPDFLSDDETDDSFAVLVPCYRNDVRGPVEGPNSQFLNAFKNLTDQHFNEGKNLMDQWISSLQNF